MKSLYSYTLPPELIAKRPATPRDSARLFIYDTASDTICFDRFSNLAKYLPRNSFLALNNTKVIPARVPVTKETGGKMELLLLPGARWGTSRVVRAMVNRKLTVGQKVYITSRLVLSATEQDKNIFTFEANFSPSKWPAILARYGHTPVPPYLLSDAMSEKRVRSRYQTVFASKGASVAAPTASLHFTKRLLHTLKTVGVPIVDVTLHVGMGTFAPVTDEHIRQKKLHGEIGEISQKTAQAITAYKKQGKRLVTVGTTATRVVEANSRKGKTTASTGEVDLFILPPYEFQAVDAMITNFHLPESSLMMLVEALLQSKKAKRHLTDLYAVAIKEGFRFYSFGDAMLIL